MGLHHVWVRFPDKSMWGTFIEASNSEIEKIAERLAFYRDHGAVDDWNTSRVVREHDADSFTRSLDQRVARGGAAKRKQDSDWPYDWQKPDV